LPLLDWDVTVVRTLRHLIILSRSGSSSFPPN
jgi:hypothetical protein